jgi:hypothetical protein
MVTQSPFSERMPVVVKSGAVANASYYSRKQTVCRPHTVVGVDARSDLVFGSTRRGVTGD